MVGRGVGLGILARSDTSADIDSLSGPHRAGPAPVS
jgi:hypothetical protein